MTATTIEFTLSPEDFSDLCCTAAMAISDWAMAGYWGDNEFTFTEIASGKNCTIHRQDLEQLMLEAAIGRHPMPRWVRDCVSRAVIDEAFGELDATCADVLIQLAAFRAVVYG